MTNNWPLYCYTRRSQTRILMIPKTAFLLIILLFQLNELKAGPPVEGGIIALIDSVIFVQRDNNVDKIKIWGVFSLAQGKGYSEPKRGYLFFEKSDGIDWTEEWKLILKYAGTGKCIAFGTRGKVTGRYKQKYKVTIRTNGKRHEPPSCYPSNTSLAHGGVYLLDENAKKNYGKPQKFYHNRMVAMLKQAEVIITAENQRNAVIKRINKQRLERQ